MIDLPPAAAHVSVGCLRPTFAASLWVSDKQQRRATHGYGGFRPSTEQHMLRAQSLRAQPPTNHDTPILPSRGPDYWQISPSITLFCTSHRKCSGRKKAEIVDEC